MIKPPAFICFLLFFGFLFVSCEDKYDLDKIAEEDEKKIQKFIEENDLDAERHPSGLYYVIEEEGSGDNPTSDSFVEITYKSTRLNGDLISQNQNFTLNLSNEMEGLRIGIPLFKRGGEGILIIPTALTFADHYYNPYQTSNVVVYYIELIDFL